MGPRGAAGGGWECFDFVRVGLGVGAGLGDAVLDAVLIVGGDAVAWTYRVLLVCLLIIGIVTIVGTHYC